MLEIIYKSKFERDIEKAQKRGKNMKKIQEVIALIVHEEPLPIKYRNHKLTGVYTGYWECHIEPDWLLVYKKSTTQLILARTGSHSDLF